MGICECVLCCEGREGGCSRRWTRQSATPVRPGCLRAVRLRAATTRSQPPTASLPPYATCRPPEASTCRSASPVQARVSAAAYSICIATYAGATAAQRSEHTPQSHHMADTPACSTLLPCALLYGARTVCESRMGRADRAIDAVCQGCMPAHVSGADRNVAPTRWSYTTMGCAANASSVSEQQVTWFQLHCFLKSNVLSRSARHAQHMTRST